MHGHAQAVAATRRRATPIAVLIVDDSAVARAAYARVIHDAPTLITAAQIGSASEAIAWLRFNQADVILLDLEMPGGGGLAALPALLEVGNGARVLIVSSAAEAGAQVTLDALALGAADTFAKPAAHNLGRSFGAELVARIERLGVRATVMPAPLSFDLRASPTGPIDVLAIGSSTGGIEALSAFLAALPQAFSEPILVTQHLPPAFMPYLARQLIAGTGRTATVATNGEPLRANHILVAPGHAHLSVNHASRGAHITLIDAPSMTRCRPSVDPMFASLAPYGGASVAVVLSGMGRDGLAGAEVLVGAGGSVIVQDEASSAVWGMPGAVARAGLASVVGTPATLSGYVASRMRR